METEKNLRAGLSPEEARRRARVAFGALRDRRNRACPGACPGTRG
ncbi:MAG: hypothetical protein ACRD2X_26990 [Vicinamibacteraceae bacterium]